MTIDVNVQVIHHFPKGTTLEDLLNKFGDKLMSQLSDALAAATASVDAAISRVTNDITSLQAQIAALQAQIASGTATQADLDALAALQAKVDALDPTNPATLTK